MQMGITFCSLCVAVAAIVFAIRSFSEERNARLVEIGVSVLRVDPTKETQVSAAREWALDLIDANAGGIRFSKEARAELMNRRLDWSSSGWGDSYSTDGTRRLRPNLRPNFQP